ncbi:MAG: long-chain fatty acid--CoA ligase [Candidatus Thalassarchaeaceae archaeon]|nr:long-chain fatty acid--CoA ligase [Candidatus Thalassarchaeaceae archaeon]
MFIPQHLIQNATEYENEPAISWKNDAGDWDTMSWGEYGANAMNIAKSLIALGYEARENMSIYSYNRSDWFTCYAAGQMAGGAVVGVYHTCSPEEVEWVVGNSQSRIVFVGDNPMDGGNTEKMPVHRLHEALANLDSVEHVIVFDGVEVLDHPKMMSWSEFYSKGNSLPDSVVLERTNAIQGDDVASLIYTSGTTGNPKGVMLTHRNMEFELNAVAEIFTYEQGEKYVSWLPLAHVFGQLVDCGYCVRQAMHMHVVDSPIHVVDYAKEVQPHLFIGVPRIYEKIYSNVKAALDAKAILRVLLKIPGINGKIKGKLKAKIGFANCRFAITGAAPINHDILRLFHKLDIPIFEGYGMTEDTAGATLNAPGAMRIGSVGKPFPGTEMMIASDGEILMRGDHVMKGYYNNPEATADTIDSEGWLHSGDVGKIDDDGFVFITGRKKEIYVSSGGKNIAPLVIEETMKSIPIVSQCFLVGDGRKYCSALFTLDAGAIIRDKFGMDPNDIPKDPAKQLAKLEELGSSIEAFTDSAEIRAEVQAAVDELNGQFSNPEQLKKFAILPRDFAVDYGELTPTLKIRRKQIRENWADVIEDMYADA